MSKQVSRMQTSARGSAPSRVVLAVALSVVLVAVGAGAAVVALTDRPVWVGATDDLGRELRVVAVRPLPEPRRDGSTPLERAIVERTSVRSFAERALTDAEIGQLLWAAQGELTSGGRTVPSAGAL